MNKRKLGNDYEDKACKYLESIGYKVLERNFRSKKGEIDIIAKDGVTIVFVEVKYRQSNSFGYAVEAVDFRKQMVIYKVAENYLSYTKRVDVPCRFDVIGFDNGRINHIKNAFGGM